MMDNTRGANTAASRTIDFRFAPAHTWTPICRVDDPHKSLVREDGALLYGFSQTHLTSWAFQRTVEFRAQTTDSPLDILQRTEDCRTPVVVTALTYPTCWLELRTAGHMSANGHRYDVILWSIQVAEHVDELLTGLHVDIYESSNTRHTGASVAPSNYVYAVPAEQVTHYPLFIDDTAEDKKNLLGAHSPVLISQPHRLNLAHASGFRPASGLETLPVVARGGETVGGALILPLDGGPTDGADQAWAHEAVEKERQYWRNLQALDLPIKISDKGLQDMLVASVRNILQARDLDTAGQPVFQVGPTVYRGLWIVDGHFLLEAAQYLHLGADARHGMQALLARAREDGSINAMADQPGLAEHPHTKETGIALATLVRQWELTGDDGWLEGLWPIVRGALDFIQELRRRARDLPADSPAYGLMPPAFSDGGVAGARPELTTILWTLIGLSHAARAARHLAPDDYEGICHMYEELGGDLRQTARTYAGTLPDGRPYTPMILPGSGRHHTVLEVDNPAEHHRIRPESATWALAQAIWPGEIFTTEDPIVRDFLHLLETLDDEEGTPTTTGWLPYRALWTYYASFAGHVWLYADRPDKAVQLLYAFCNHAAPTRVWREEQPLRASGHDQLWGDMPHNWAAAELVRLVRHLIVFEREGGLELLPGAPTGWIDCPAGLRVERTPTRFGDISVVGSRPNPEQPGTIIISTEPRAGRHTAADRHILHVPDGGWRVTVNDSYLGTVQGPLQLSLPLP